MYIVCVARSFKPVLCSDIEGHIGFDGRFYLLDFARTMPVGEMFFLETKCNSE